MNARSVILAERATALREAFDGTFAHEAQPARAETEDLLTIRVGADRYALRLAEVAGLVSDRTVTPLPGGSAALLGLAAVRGAVVVVYDLATLLGGATGRPSRWLVLVRTPALLALAFERLDGQVRVPVRSVADGPAADRDPRGGPGAVVRVGDVTLPVLHLPGLVAAISGLGHPTGERGAHGDTTLDV